MTIQENIPIKIIPDNNGNAGNNPVEPSQDEISQEFIDNLTETDGIKPLNPSDLSYDENVPSELVNDDVPDLNVTETALPSDASNISDIARVSTNLNIGHRKEVGVTKKDRASAKIRDDNNAEDVGF